jgi:hypothetical protein
MAVAASVKFARAPERQNPPVGAASKMACRLAFPAAFNWHGK